MPAQPSSPCSKEITQQGSINGWVPSNKNACAKASMPRVKPHTRSASSLPPLLGALSAPFLAAPLVSLTEPSRTRVMGGSAGENLYTAGSATANLTRGRPLCKGTLVAAKCRSANCTPPHGELPTTTLGTVVTSTPTLSCTTSHFPARLSKGDAVTPVGALPPPRRKARACQASHPLAMQRLAMQRLPRLVLVPLAMQRLASP